MNITGKREMYLRSMQDIYSNLALDSQVSRSGALCITSDGSALPSPESQALSLHLTLPLSPDQCTFPPLPVPQHNLFVP